MGREGYRGISPLRTAKLTNSFSHKGSSIEFSRVAKEAAVVILQHVIQTLNLVHPEIERVFLRQDYAGRTMLAVIIQQVQF